MAKTVVIIDDDSDDLDMMGETFRQIDPTILCVSFVFAEEAVRLLKELVLHPDFIFIDVNMPKLGGMECLQEKAGRRIQEHTDYNLFYFNAA